MSLSHRYQAFHNPPFYRSPCWELREEGRLAWTSGGTNQLVDGLAVGLLNQLVRDNRGELVALTGCVWERKASGPVGYRSPGHGRFGRGGIYKGDDPGWLPVAQDQLIRGHHGRPGGEVVV